MRIVLSAARPWSHDGLSWLRRLWDMHDRRYKQVRAQEVRKLSAKRLKMLPLTIPQSDLARM
jgi:hypothetical protein